MSEKELNEFIAISEKEGAKYKDREEARQAADNLVQFAELLYKLWKEQHGWDLRLKEEPGGFKMPSNGRTCSVCHKCIIDDIWYDGQLKCENCFKPKKQK